MVGSRLAVDWVHHAIQDELQLRNLLAKGANMLADFVKSLSHLWAERACIALQFCINHLHRRHNQVQLCRTTDNTKRFA